MPGQQFHPTAVLSSFRKLNPGKFDEFSDADLLDSIKRLDPQTYALVDPQLLGSEISPTRPGLPGPGLAPPPVPPPSLHRQSGWGDTAVTTGLRVGGGLIGGVVGALGANPVTALAGQGVGMAAGDYAAQQYQIATGLSDTYHPMETAIQGGMGLVPLGELGGLGTTGRYAVRMGQNALLGTAGTLAEDVTTGTPPSWGQVGTSAATGLAVGGVFHGATEGVGALARRAPGFGDATGDLGGLGVPPPPSPVDQLVTARGAMIQHEQEEQRIGAGLISLYGKDARPAGSADFHTAVQAKDYFAQLAALNPQPDPHAAARVYTGLQDTLTTSFEPPEASPYPPAPPRPLQLEAGEFGDPNRLDYLGSQPPPPATVDRLGGQLEGALQAPPGPPRLTGTGGPPELRLTGENVPRGIAEPVQPSLLPRAGQSRAARAAQPFQQPIRQTGEVGGAPPDFAQWRLPGIDEPGQERSYATGPNAGPRRPGEAHGQPRQTRRQIQVEGQTKYEYPPSTLHAEDPGTYPPEVRREMARMLHELDTIRHTQLPGGNSQEQIDDVMAAENVDASTAIGILKKSGASSGRALSGAPVYWDIRKAAEGSYPSNADSETMREALRGALHDGKGNGLTDAMAQVARGRLAQEARGGRTLEGEKAGTFVNEKIPSGAAGRTRRVGYSIASAEGAGDHLINWIDRNGEHALRESDLTDVQRDVRRLDRSELWAAIKTARDYAHDESLPAVTREYYVEALKEGVRRDLITPEQLALTMEGPGGDKGPSLFDFEGGAGEGGPPTLSQAERNASAKREASGESPPVYGQPGGESQPSMEPGYEQIRATLSGDDLAARRPLLKALFPEYDTPRPDYSSEFHNNVWGELNEPKRFGASRLFFNDLNQRIREARAAGRLSGESQPSLPGTEGVREQSIPTPEVADLPFSLTAEPSRPPTAAESRASLAAQRKGGLFSQLSGEEGVLLPPPPAVERENLKKWLKKNEKEYGGERWYSTVEHHLENGEWDKAWSTAVRASLRSLTLARAAATTPERRAAIDRTIRGTALQDDLNTQIIAGARKRAGVGDAPPVRDFPPSPRGTQAGAARGKASIGPAGIINPGPVQRPLSSIAPALRSGRLDNTVLKMILDATSAEGMSTVPGNTDSMGRAFRQVGEEILVGKNLRLLREAGVKIAPEELAQHFLATVSDLGRGLNLLKQFAATNEEILTEAAQKISFGSVLRGLLGREPPPPPRMGAGRRVLGPTAQAETADIIAQGTTAYNQNMVANTLQQRPSISVARAIHDASYPYMLLRWSTAVRDYVSTHGRYTTDSIVHALTIPATLGRDPQTASLARAMVKERGFTMFQKGAAITPRSAWQENLQSMFDLSTEALSHAAPKDVRHYVKLLTDIPEAAAHFLGGMGGENLRQVAAEIPVLRSLTNPKVQRVLSSFRTAQELSGRTVVGSASLRALLRVKGLDPDVIMRLPTPEIIKRVGGPDAWEDLLFTSTSHALEATFAGQLSKDSIPGALVRAVNTMWPLKFGMPFPKFNFSSAPRFLFDHSAVALVDLLRFPLDAAGITAAKGTMAGGRLTRGVRAQEIERYTLPALELKIGAATRRQGVAMQDLLSTQSEWEIRNRQVARLEKRAQTPLRSEDGVDVLPSLDPLERARGVRDQLARRRDQIIADRQDALRTVGDHKATQKTLLAQLADARGINAPNFAQYLARMTVGTVGLTGAAWIIRSQPEAQGTKWYQYPIPNSITGRKEGDDPVMMDFRPFAPFVQHLFVADVLHDFSQHTDWAAVRKEVMTPEEGMVASPLDWNRALWNHYEGKYTAGELGAQFAQAFLSISRAAGTTLTVTDLLTQNGWPSPQDAANAIVGTIGQFLSRWDVGLGQARDVIGAFDPEEAKIRTPPKATLEDWERPLGAPIGSIPYASRVIPEQIDQTTGKAVAAQYPLMRALFGIGTSSPGFIEEERVRVGLPGSSLYIHETGDVEVDRMNAENYARILQQALGDPIDPLTGEVAIDPNTGKPAHGILSSPSYLARATPARRRDYLQQIIPYLKAAAQAETRAYVNAKQYEGATITGEAARKKARQLRALDDLDGALPPEVFKPAGVTVESVDQDDPLGAPPPGPPGGGVDASGPPAAPF